MKHSNVFYKINREKQFEPVKDARVIRNKAGLDLFRVGFNLYEGSTGLLAKAHGNIEELKSTIAKLESDADLRDRYKKAITENLEKYGLSPRYTRPDEKYADFFPPPPPVNKSILAPTLDGQKHYFVEDSFINNVPIYALKNIRNDPLRALYIRYEGWMLQVGNVYDLQSVTRLLLNGVPDFRQIMTESLDAALALPDKWANPGFANFLGRLEETNIHNQPIREARRAERQHEQEERARREEEKSLQEQREYEATVFDAEQSILNKRELRDADVRGASLFLHLFRQNGIDLPLKTQGWVNSSLVRLFYNESDNFWSYSYRGRDSTVFYSYLERLAEVIEKKYEQQPETDNVLEPNDDLEI